MDRLFNCPSIHPSGTHGIAVAIVNKFSDVSQIELKTLTTCFFVFFFKVASILLFLPIYSPLSNVVIVISLVQLFLFQLEIICFKTIIIFFLFQPLSRSLNADVPEQLITPLVSLGHISMLAPDQFASPMKSIVANFIVKDLLMNDRVRQAADKILCLSVQS